MNKRFRCIMMMVMMTMMLSWNVSAEAFNRMIPTGITSDIFSDRTLRLATFDMIEKYIPDPGFRDEFANQIYGEGSSIEDRDYVVALLSLGMSESGWMIPKSYEIKDYMSPKNNNGSYDVGPLMMNSYNLKSSDFKRKFEPGPVLGDYGDDDTRYIMAMCIKYFLYLKEDIPAHSIYAVYNGGRSKYFAGTMPKGSIRHQYKTNRFFVIIEKEFNARCLYWDQKARKDYLDSITLSKIDKAKTIINSYDPMNDNISNNIHYVIRINEVYFKDDELV